MSETVTKDTTSKGGLLERDGQTKQKKQEDKIKSQKGQTQRSGATAEQEQQRKKGRLILKGAEKKRKSTNKRTKRRKPQKN